VITAQARAYNAAREAMRRSDLVTLPQGQWQLIYADPPWRYNDLGHSRRIDRHYPVMRPLKIAQMPINSIAAADSVLFLWATVPMLLEALQVMAAWQFSYKSNLAWDKEIIGMGHYARIQHELLLFGTRGKPPKPADHSVSSVIRARRTKHSVKPVQGTK
jgi:N6-adenosine-specific RNA methylase IME4